MPAREPEPSRPPASPRPPVTIAIPADGAAASTRAEQAITQRSPSPNASMEWSDGKGG